MPDDPYQRSAEFLDVMIAGAWEVIAPALRAALSQVRAAAGAVVDLGAGTGRGVRAICASVPDAPVLAVEPSSAMRAVLLARICDEPELRRRVTVLAADAATVELPDGLRALVALNVLGHLAPAERRSLWGRTVGVLVPGGALIVNLAPPLTSMAGSRTRVARESIGGLDYEGWASAEPSGTDQVTWHMEYRVLHRGRLLSQVRVDYPWQVMGDAELAAEAAEVGLAVRSADAPELGLRVLTRPGDENRTPD